MKAIRAYAKAAAVLAAALGLASLWLAGHVWWSASRAVEESDKAIASESQIPFTTISWDRPSAAALEWVSAPAIFTDAAFLDDRLIVTGPAGVTEYGTEGGEKARYRTGLELPPAPPVHIAPGLVLRGAGPALYVATAGEGLLIFELQEDAFRVEQVRADQQPYRDSTTVLPLPTGRVLYGTKAKGVLVWDGRTIQVLHRSLAEQHVTALAGDESNLWIGTLDRGVLHWHAGQLDRFGEEEGLPDRQVLSLAVDGASTYVGTPFGVAEFRDGRFQRRLGEGLFAKTLSVDEKRLLVGTLDAGVVEIPLERSRLRGPRPPLLSADDTGTAPVQRILNGNGARYALTENGLYAIGPSGGEQGQLLEKKGTLLADRNISALSIDPSGKLWVGYFDRGLDIVDLPAGQATHIEDEQVFCINRIVHDARRGLTAVGTANGLVFFDASGRQQQVLRREDGLIASHVTDIVLSEFGMTVATPAGLTFIDRGGMRSLYAFHGLVNNHVYTLASQGGQLLAGTLGGLSVLDGGVIQASYTTGNSALQHNWITAIVRFEGRWLVGTYGAGIVELDSAGLWRTLPEASGPFEVNMNAMVATQDRVYAGTLDRGLYVYNHAAGRWRTFTEGLPSRNVTALAVDQGWLYVGTDNGLVRIEEHQLTLP